MITRASSLPLPPGFNRLAWSNLAAQSAEQIALAAAPIVAVLALGAGAGETGLLQTAQTLPFLVLSVPAGVLADRMSHRRLMAGAEALRAMALAGVLALAQLGLLTLPLLALLGFVGACGTVAYSVAAPALVPALVPAEALPVANGRIELARTVAFASGPALAGALVGWTGGAPAFGFAAALSACAVVLLAGLREPPRPARASHRVLHDLREGAAFVFGSVSPPSASAPRWPRTASAWSPARCRRRPSSARCRSASWSRWDRWPASRRRWCWCSRSGFPRASWRESA